MLRQESESVCRISYKATLKSTSVQWILDDNESCPCSIKYNTTEQQFPGTIRCKPGPFTLGSEISLYLKRKFCNLRWVGSTVFCMTEGGQSKTTTSRRVSTYVIFAVVDMLPGCWRSSVFTARQRVTSACRVLLRYQLPPLFVDAAWPQLNRKPPRVAVCLALKCQNQTSMVGVVYLWLTTKVDVRESHWFGWRWAYRSAHSLLNVTFYQSSHVGRLQR